MPKSKSPYPYPSNPWRWPDPRMMGSSEYASILEHAQSVWDSNPDVPARERAKYVRDSLREMQDWLTYILGK